VHHLVEAFALGRGLDFQNPLDDPRFVAIELGGSLDRFERFFEGVVPSYVERVAVCINDAEFEPVDRLAVFILEEFHGGSQTQPARLVNTKAQHFCYGISTAYW
jgi:hypothetical protein